MPRRPSPGEFQRTIVRMIATFLTVSAIDVTVGSLLTHKLRFWFPNWIDPQWDVNPLSWVVYSQSYLSGVVFIPFLAAALVREFAPRAGPALRTTALVGTAAVFSFIAWWKGGLMIAHHKELEAVGWVVLTAIVWGVLRLGEALPELLRDLTPRALAAGLATGVAGFFLVMAVLDPLLQLEVQNLAWSRGLSIEVGFFVPAGLVLAAVAARLRRATGSEAVLETDGA